MNAAETCSDTVLGHLLFDLLDALHDHTLAVNLDALDEPFQDELLVLTLQKREVCLDAVEVGTVWDIEYWSRFQALACLKYILGLMYLEIVHEDCEILPMELI